jgi:hypothetical protein
MSVGSVLVISPSAESTAESAVVRFAQPATQPISGIGSSRENDSPQTLESQQNARQDEVKVQIEPPGALAVYQFLNQDGTIVVQVPPQQWLDLAQEISKELAQESATEAAPVKKGEGNGH